MNLKNIRLSRGFTQARLAAAIGTDRHHISKLESGQREPSYRTLLALAKALNCSLDDLVSTIMKNTIRGK